MKHLRTLLMAGALLVAPAGAAFGDVEVVASIKPIHSLVAGVMKGVGTPQLLVRGNQSPHDYSMKPSDAQALEKAEVVFWIGGDMEQFLTKPLGTLAAKASVVTLSKAHGLTTLKFREGGPFESHEDHDDHDHDHDKDGHEHSESDHDDHDHDKDGHEHSEADHDDHDHDKDEHEHAEADHDHDHDKDEHEHDEHEHDEAEHAGHHHGEIDQHIWLDPLNAKALLHEIEEALSAADPDHAATYKSNAAAMAGALDALVAEVNEQLEPVRGRPFVVFHDAYQYFEKRFDLNAVGSITVIPDVTPGAARLREIQDKVKTLGATCVFAEPQFDTKLVDVVASSANTRAGVLDPLGSNLEDGPDLYFQMVRSMAKSARDCLS